MPFHPERFAIIGEAPVQMLPHERVVLYGLVVGLQPSRILEIGTFRGGSTMIMCAALDDLDRGRIVCVDPNPQLSPEHRKAISHRAEIIAESSPAALSPARELAGGAFDLAFIDGDHSYTGVVRDIEGTLPVLADRALLLFHDAHNHEVRAGIEECLERHPNQLIDAGLVSTAMVETGELIDNREILWGGLRLVIFERSKQTRTVAPNRPILTRNVNRAPLKVRLKHAVKVILGFA